MSERIIVLLVVFGWVLLHDSSLLKSGTNKRDKAVYVILMIISLYLGISYAGNLNFLGFYDLADFVLSDTARLIDKWLTVPKE